MKTHDGVGLAAPQVGLDKQIFVYRSERLIHSDWGNNSWHPINIVINPVILRYSPETVEYEEGCLSIPGVYGNVVRSRSIHAKWDNVYGDTNYSTLHGTDARVFQHETDHLNGILFPQRIHFQKTGEWIDLKSYSTSELNRLDTINELRQSKTKKRPKLGLHHS